MSLSQVASTFVPLVVSRLPSIVCSVPATSKAFTFRVLSIWVAVTLSSVVAKSASPMAKKRLMTLSWSYERSENRASGYVFD